MPLLESFFIDDYNNMWEEEGNYVEIERELRGDKEQGI